MTRFSDPFRRRVENEERLCRVDFNLDDRLESVCALIARMAPIWTDSRPWHLDLSDCNYLGPHAGAAIVASLLCARHQGQAARISLPQGSKQLQAFCEFSGLRHYATGSPFPTGDQPRNVTIPMQQVHTSNFHDPDPIVAMIRQHRHLAEDAEDYLRICINEVIQNVEDHAVSPVGAIAAARFMEKSGEIRVAIVDRGVGMATTLRQRYPQLADAREALQRAIDGGVSAKSRPNNMGLGISNLCGIVSQLHEEVFIVSEDGFADGKAGRRPVSQSMGTRFPGTGVFFSVPVRI